MFSCTFALNLCLCDLSRWLRCSKTEAMSHMDCSPTLGAVQCRSHVTHGRFLHTGSSTVQKPYHTWTVHPHWEQYSAEAMSHMDCSSTLGAVQCFPACFMTTSNQLLLTNRSATYLDPHIFIRKLEKQCLQFYNSKKANCTCIITEYFLTVINAECEPPMGDC